MTKEFGDILYEQLEPRGRRVVSAWLVGWPVELVHPAHSDCDISINPMRFTMLLLLPM